MRFSSTIFNITCVLVSGICWYLSLGLTGSFWYLQWLAPIPVLYVSLNSKGWPAFGYVFTAYLIGRLSWLPYLLAVLPVMPAIIFTVLPALIFALLAATARKVVLRTNHWYAVLALPVLFTAFEYIMFLFSRDGTMTSIAYSQSNFLPVVQVASLTGIQGITFLLLFMPYAIAMALYYRKQNRSVKPLLIVAGVTLSAVLVFGTIRITNETEKKQRGLQVGFTCREESIYKNMLEPNTAKEIDIANQYLQDVPVLAAQEAKVVVLPEKAVIVNDSSYQTIKQMFAQAAKDNHVSIVTGLTKLKKSSLENNNWVFDENGNLLADYKKVHLFEGELLDGFTTGDTISVFNMNNRTQATAICKDMDYQQYLLHYAKAKPAVLYAPAWDFVQDGWLHSRMAIMRGAEGGYGIVRNAREGRLTISDYRGKVLYEASSEDKKHTTLMGSIPLVNHESFYSKTGDWFSILNLVVSVVFIVLLFVRSRKAML